MSPNLLTWFGRDGILSWETARQLLVGPLWSPLALLLWRPWADFVTVGLFSVQVVAAVSLVVGYRSRLSAVIVWLCLQSFHLRNPLIALVMDPLLRVNGFLLLFAPLGAAFSVDARWRGCARELAAPWAQRLIQVQMTLSYWRSFWGKTGGETWRNGSALYYITHSPDDMRFRIAGLLDHVALYRVVNYVSLAFELSMCTLIWWKRARYPLMLVGVIFHVSMLVYFNLDGAELAILAVYATFVEPEDLRRIGQRFCSVLAQEVAKSPPNPGRAMTAN